MVSSSAAAIWPIDGESAYWLSRNGMRSGIASSTSSARLSSTVRSRTASWAFVKPALLSHAVCMSCSGGAANTVQTAASGWAASNAPQLKTASSKCGETMKRRGVVSLMGLAWGPRRGGRGVVAAGCEASRGKFWRHLSLGAIGAACARNFQRANRVPEMMRPGLSAHRVACLASIPGVIRSAARAQSAGSIITSVPERS
jgi:hypothetical protein